MSPKPRAEVIRPELTRLPPLTGRRRRVRWILSDLAKFLTWLFLRKQVFGLDLIPRTGPLIVVTNHLGDADAALVLAISPTLMEVLAKAELYDYPCLGKVMDAYGVIWLHRGQPDRRALRAAMDALKEGRILAIAPEGRESLSGGLEEGLDGAAYLAIKMDVPLLPIAITGTENQRVYGNMTRLRKTDVSLTVGSPFKLGKGEASRAAIRLGTHRIMQTLADYLPYEYRGQYANQSGSKRGSG